MSNSYEYRKYFTSAEGEMYIPRPRVYLDYLCSEYKNVDIKKKLNDLGFLITNGFSLVDYLKEYIEAKAPYIVSALDQTLIYYIQQLRFQEYHHFTSILYENMSVFQLAELLQAELKLRYTYYESLHLHQIEYTRDKDFVVNDFIKKFNDNVDESKKFFVTVGFSEWLLGV